MKLLGIPLFAAVAAGSLALAGCDDTPNDAARNGEDSAMATPAGEGSEAASNAPVEATPEAGATTTARAGDVDSNPPGDACGASKVAAFVSQKATPAVRARVAAEVGHDRIRWVGPDTVVTMDFRPDRLNVTLDENDVITGGNCS